MTDVSTIVLAIAGVMLVLFAVAFLDATLRDFRAGRNRRALLWGILALATFAIGLFCAYGAWAAGIRLP